MNSLSTQEHVIYPSEANFPIGLTQLIQPPKQLFAKGQIDTLKQPTIAILGPRSPSKQAMINAASFARQLVERGVSICAELTEGTSAFAIQGAIKTGLPHSAIGIAASGLNLVYPTKLTSLSQLIEQNGLLISEYPADTLAYAKHLQERARLVAAISQGVLVIEASLKSNAMQVASYAAELGREIFCIPGPIQEPRSRGPHLLIKNGAKLVEDIEDILEDFPFSSINRAR
jgi:DNA processing protein